MSRYTSSTDADRKAMLAKIGVASIDELFSRQIPDALTVKTDMNLAPGAGEQEVYEHLRALAARNVSCEDEISFLGAGMWLAFNATMSDAQDKVDTQINQIGG